MTLQESFTIIVAACNEARLNKQERINVEVALQAIVLELNTYDELKRKKTEPPEIKE